MENSKLFSALSYFDKYEQNRLRKYIHSPYFNKNKGLIILFEEITKYHNKVKSGKNVKPIENEVLWSKIYPDKKYEDVRFRKLRSDLLKLIEGFLAQQLFEENPLHQATYLIEAIGRKKMKKLFESTSKTARKLADLQLLKPSNYYYYKYQIEKNLYQVKELEFKRFDKKNLEVIANNLDRFYLAEKLKYHCAILTQKSVNSHNYELLFIDEIIEHIKKYKYEEVPPIAVYYQQYLTLEEVDNETHYFEFKKMLRMHSDIFPKLEAQELYKSALNICIRNINKGRLTYYKEYFDLYEAILSKELIYVDGVLAPLHFKNIVVIALRLGKYEWTEKFIHEYQHRLPDANRENAVSFNLARLYFYQKRYDDVISLLQTVEYDDITYNLSSKTILIRTYYEIDEIDALDSLLESFRTYLGRQDKIPTQRKQNYLALVKFIRKLSRVIPGEQKSIKKIRAEFESSEGMISKDEWLKEKIEALEKGRKS